MILIIYEIHRLITTKSIRVSRVKVENVALFDFLFHVFIFVELRKASYKFGIHTNHCSYIVVRKKHEVFLKIIV